MANYKSAIRHWLGQNLPAAWYKPTSSIKLLVPLAKLFEGLVQLRRLLYQHKLLTVQHFPVPIIVVGNITVGGTGKTPLIIWLAHFLAQHGYQPGIICRGYQGRQRQAALVHTNSDPALVGDEAVLLAQEAGCPVAVARRRSQAVELLLASSSCDIILSDDGLQHYALGRTLEIAVLDGERRLGNGYCLPAGPLREPANRLASVDFVVCNGGSSNSDEWAMRLLPGQVHNLLKPNQTCTLTDLIGQPIHAVAGIGNPQRFFQLLKQQGLTVIEHAFPDHYAFRLKDIDFGPGLVLMTQKDAVKCRSFAPENVWYLLVQAELAPKFGERLIECIKEHGVS